MKINNYGFSLIELLITIGIIGILAMIAVPSYLRYKEAPVKAAMKLEAAELSKFLEYAYSADGFYHPKIYTMGYRPSKTMIANAGFYRSMGYDLHSDCNLIPPKKENGLSYGSFLTLDTNKLYAPGHVSSYTRGSQICNDKSKKYCTPHPSYAYTWAGSISKNFKSGDSTCKSAIGNFVTSCESFTLYSRAKLREGATNYAAVYTNERGLFCYSDGNNIERF